MSLGGGIAGRLFEPVAAGGRGSGPAELGGVYSLSDGGAAVVAGFIARKQQAAGEILPTGHRPGG